MNASLSLEKQKNGVIVLLLILLLAVALRTIFFNGPFGSDEIVYLARALDVADWRWTSANYNGALRYGYNIPEGLLIAIFGLNMFTANLWPLLCSLLEIAAVFYFAWKYIGEKAAIFAALFLAFIPLHVAVSTRLHADPAVSMFLTLSFVVFYRAEREANKSLYFLTGILLGCVFWVKELAAVTFFAFALYPLYLRKIKAEWIYVLLGGTVMLLGHFALMRIIAGDPLHAIKTVAGQVNKGFIAANKGEDSPWYYFHYLFLDIKHTWLAPLLALLALPMLKNPLFLAQNTAVRYTAFWLASLLIVLSFFPVSLSPLKFAMKQANYITLFLAPITIIAGTVIAAMPRKTAWLLTAVVLSGGLLLSALEQQAYQVFTANSRGLLAYADSHPNQEIYGSVNNSRMDCFYRIFAGKNCESLTIHDYSEIPADAAQAGDKPILAVIDRETQGWGDNDIKLEKAPACWRETGTVAPAATGNSRFVLGGILEIAKLLPASLAEKIQALQNPKPAKIYAANLADIWCQRETRPGGETAESSR